MTPASQILLNRARHICAPYIATPTACAAMVTGSVAKGIADFYSDLDMAVYYDDTLPDEETLHAIRTQLGGSDRKWVTDGREQGGFAEAFRLDGVEVQLIHATTASWEAMMAQVQIELKVDTPLPKALEGMSACVPLHGAAIIARWKEQIAAYPSALTEAMVTHYLKFFPIWGLASHFQSRDATIWYHQILVEAAQNLCGILAGLNQIYFTPFQFKRMHRFTDLLTIAPPDVAERIGRLFAAPLAEALPELERLVAETLSLVERELPQIDTTAARSRIGWRHEPWSEARQIAAVPVDV